MTAIAPPVASAQRVRARPDRGRQGWIRRGPLLPALIFTIIVTQLPFVLTLWYSLQSWSLVRPGSEHFVGFANYTAVFQDSQFWTTALNTVIMTVGSVLIAMLIGIGLALILDRKFIGRGIVRTLLITPFLVMPVAAALLWKTVMLDPTFGIVNWVLRPFGIGTFDWIGQVPLLSVMIEMIWQWTPFMMLLVLAGLQSQPKDIVEAAGVDGAKPLSIFRELTLPHLRRYIELGVVLGAIYLINEGHGKLTVGIRPEHLSVGGDGELTLEVALVEDLGSDSYVYGYLPGNSGSQVIVRATRDHPRPGEVVKVKVDTAHLHLFDGATGLRIGD